MNTKLLLTLILVFSFSFGVTTVAAAEDDELGAQTVDHVLDEVERLIKAQKAAIEAGSLDPLEESFEIAEGASGPNAEVQRFIADVMNNSVRLRNAYMNELQEIGWMRALDAERLAADQDLSESRELLRDGRQVLVKYSRLTMEYIESSPGGIELLDLPVEEKRSFRAGYEEGLARSKPVRRRIWDLEFDTFDEFGKIFDLLGDNRSQWQIVNGQIMFESQALLDVFNSHLMRMQELTNEQFRIQQQNVQSLR